MDQHFLGDALASVNGTKPNNSVAVASASTGVLVALVLVYTLLGHRFVVKSKYFTEGSAAAALGLATGLVLLVVFNHYNGLLSQLLVFNAASFFTYLLPPVIFYCGISVEKKQFFRNLPSILLFGVLGTFLSFTCIALFLYGFSKMKLFTLEDCFALGAIFAATDSVAVLQVLDQARMPLLFSLAFGEGVINDATSVVLLGAVNNIFPGSDPTSTLSWAIAGRILGQFCYLFVTSFALGAASGLGIAFLLKRFSGGWQGPHQEVAVIGLLAYLSYLLAEVLGLSGILALFCCGITASQYALLHVSPAGRITVDNVFRTLSYLSEGLIFIYVGLDALDPRMWRASASLEALWLTLMLLALLAFSRAAAVAPLALVHNWWSRDTLGSRDVVIVWWSGMIRGAVSVALVYHHFDKHSSSSGADEHRSTLVVTTLMVVLTSILGYGAITKPLMQLMLGDKSRPLLEQLKTLGNGHTLGGLLHYIRDYEQPGVCLEDGARAELSAALNESARSSSSEPDEAGERQRLLGAGCLSGGPFDLGLGLGLGEGEGEGAEAARCGGGAARLQVSARPGPPGEAPRQHTAGQQWNLRFMSRLNTWWSRFDVQYMQPLFGVAGPVGGAAAGGGWPAAGRSTVQMHQLEQQQMQQVQVRQQAQHQQPRR